MSCGRGQRGGPPWWRRGPLHELGGTVIVIDPEALDNARELHPELGHVGHPIAAAQDADLLLQLTEWPEFSHVDLHRLANRVTSPKVIDGRGTLTSPPPLARSRLDPPSSRPSLTANGLRQILRRRRHHLGQLQPPGPDADRAGSTCPMTSVPHWHTGWRNT